VIWRRVGACALILTAVVLLSVLGRGGGGSEDTSGPPPAEPPSARYLSSPCDGPSLQVIRVRCGWWREPHTSTVTAGDASTRVTFWRVHRGPHVQAPARADRMTAAEVTETFRYDMPDLPSAPPSAPWVFTHWYLALPLTVGLLIGVRALFTPPWKSRASREI
jgi:hypothetical protein